VIVLFAAVALVLVIGCTNVAGLFLARGIARAPEMAVRGALGANRRQLLAFVLTESGLLGLTGGVLGLGLATVLVRVAVALAPPELPMIHTAHLDPRVLAFAVLITVGAALAFALAPALYETGLESHRVLRSASRSVTGGPLVGLARRGLVGVQVALALVVLSGAATLTRTLVQLEHTPLGFDASHLVFFKFDAVVPGSKNHGIASFPARVDALRDRIVQEFPSTPGLGKVTTAYQLPFSNSQTFPYTVDGALPSKDKPGKPMRYELALDDYFGVMGIPLRRGRAFTPRDDRHAPPVVVVNESMARAAWPGQDPIGHGVRVVSDSIERFWTVVGVVADDRFNDLAAPATPTTYFPGRQEEWDDPWFVVRTHGDPEHALKLVGRAVAGMDSMFVVRLITTGPELLRARLARPRALTAIFNGLSATALLLAALGLFGVLSADVRERRREMAVRAALGATPMQLRSLVLVQTVGVAAIGVACGAPLVAGASHLLQNMVSDVHPLDALTVIAIAAVVLAIVGAATYGPMVRASRVEVRTALATE
jgi:predicted permease